MQRRTQRMVGRVAVVAALVFTALGITVAPAAADTCGPTPSGIGPRTAPFGLARQQPSLDVALARLPFRPVVPRSFGRPFRIWVRAGEPRFRSLGLVYRRSEREWFQLNQSRSTTARAVQEALARDIARRDPCGFDARLMRLAGGPLALVIVTPDRVVVNFRRGRLDVQVLGPRALGRWEAVRLANVGATSNEVPGQAPGLRRGGQGGRNQRTRRPDLRMSDLESMRFAASAHRRSREFGHQRTTAQTSADSGRNEISVP